MTLAKKWLPLKIFLRDYGWIHLGLGLIGNGTFFIGSILFLPSLEPYKTLGVWLFILGSFLMLVGSVGRFLVDLFKREERNRTEKAQENQWRSSRFSEDRSHRGHSAVF